MGLLNTEAGQIDTDSTAELSSSRACSSKSRVLWSALIAIMAGLLVVALCTHLPGDMFNGLRAAADKAQQKQEVVMAGRTCPGTVNVAGLGQAALINTKSEAGQTTADQIEVQGDTLVAHMGGRGYFGDTCVENTYNPSYYKGFPLLGNTLKYTMDMSGAGCGCNAAVYLASMKQNSDPSHFGDYYCDANSVGGVACTEIDIQEANMFSWHSTLHTSNDKGGQGVGYGGTASNTWEDGQYGPGGSCIDTRRPFNVAVSFPTKPDGVTVQSMQVQLTQDGSPCPLSVQIDNYPMAEISSALSNGMTPVVSFWSADDMTWLDGKGPKGGACTKDAAYNQCPDSVRIYGFSLEHGVTNAAAPAAAVPAAQTEVIMPVPQVDDPLWASFPAKDTFAFSNVHEMDASDISACKQYAVANNVAAFVVWRGTAYFRAESGATCRANLKDSDEATTYILRSTMEPAQGVPGMSSAGLGQETAGSVEPAVQGLTSAGATGVPGWNQARDATGGIYYYNTATGETSWSLPIM
jgi:hypothetical protein